MEWGKQLLKKRDVSHILKKTEVYCSTNLLDWSLSTKLVPPSTTKMFRRNGANKKLYG